MKVMYIKKSLSDNIDRNNNPAKQNIGFNQSGSKRFKRYKIHMLSSQYLRVSRLFENILAESSPITENNITKNYVYLIPCNCGKSYKGKT